MHNHPTRQLPTLTTTAKSINNTSRYSQQPWTFSIANRKKQELEKTRMKEIQLENMVLKNKISSIRDRRHSQLNRSDRKYLHENLRNQFKRTTKIDNLSHRKRMQQQKATIDTKQLEKQWEDQLIIRKTISKHRRDGDKSSSRSVSYNYSGIDKGDKVEKISKQRKMDGLTVQISIQEYSHVLLIWGAVKESGVWVVMVVEREKIQKYFQGQNCRKMMENIMTGLRFDRQLNILYYLTDEKDLQQHFISDQCSQFDFSTLRKAIQKQHQTIESKNLKTVKNSETNIIQEKPSKLQPSPHQDPPPE